LAGKAGNAFYLILPYIPFHTGGKDKGDKKQVPPCRWQRRTAFF